MKSGRIRRNKWILLVGCISLASIFFFKITPSKLPNFSELISATLSFSSIATAMFFACFSLIPAFSNSKFINALQELGTDMKLMDRLLISTLIFFLNSALSFVVLFFSNNSTSLISMIILAFWFCTACMGLMSTIYIIILLIKSFEFYYEQNSENTHEKRP